MSKPPEASTRLLLVRHGEVVAEAQGKFLGFTDVGLSPHGREQLALLARRLPGPAPERVFCSDLERAVDSARILCRGSSLVPEERSVFREMDMGDWDGKDWREIDRRYPGRKKFHFSNLNEFHFPNGEYWNPFRNRVLRGLREIIRENPGKTIVLVAHAGVNRIVLAQALKLPYKNMFFIEQAYACLNIIEYYSGYAMVKLVNGTFPK
jgi:broad specificity phosphatase PhoE